MQIEKVVEDSVTIFTVTGAVSAEEIIAMANEEMAAAHTQHRLWDFTRASSVRLSTAALERVAQSLSPRADDAKAVKVALVGSKKVNIGLGKIFQAFASQAGLPDTYRVFRTTERAKQWLRASPTQ